MVKRFQVDYHLPARDSSFKTRSWLCGKAIAEHQSMMHHSVALEDGWMDLSRKERVREKKTKPDELVVLWISGDREVALKMAFMYTFNSKRFKWGWKNVTLVVWGPSAKLLAEDKELQEHIFDMKEKGVKLLACKKCSDLYGVSDDLRRLGIEVKYMGKPLTDYLRDDSYRVVTI